MKLLLVQALILLMIVLKRFRIVKNIHGIMIAICVYIGVDLLEHGYVQLINLNTLTI